MFPFFCADYEECLFLEHIIWHASTMGSPAEALSFDKRCHCGGSQNIVDLIGGVFVRVIERLFAVAATQKRQCVAFSSEAAFDAPSCHA